MFQAELWFRGLVSRPRSVACYRPRRQRSRQGSADATGRGRARGVFYLLSALCITNHHPPANRPAQARCPRLGLRLCAPPRRAKSSTNPPWSALSQPPGSACGGHYIDHPHQRPEGRFSAIHGEGGSLDCEISPSCAFMRLGGGAPACTLARPQRRSPRANCCTVALCYALSRC